MVAALWCFGPQYQARALALDPCALVFHIVSTNLNTVLDRNSGENEVLHSLLSGIGKELLQVKLNCP
jgi:hypothetical protein